MDVVARNSKMLLTEEAWLHKQMVKALAKAIFDAWTPEEEAAQQKRIVRLGELRLQLHPIEELFTPR